MKTILNQEHIEARQAEVTEKNRLLKEKMSPEDQAKFKIVEDAVADLESKGIVFYLFAWLPNPTSPDKNSMMQYNDLSTVVGFDEKGNIKQEVAIINESLLYSTWNIFGQSHQGDYALWTGVQYGAILREQQRMGFF